MRPYSHSRHRGGRCPAALLLLAATLSALAAAQASGAQGAGLRAPSGVTIPERTMNAAAGDPPRVAAERMTREGNGQDGTLCQACHGTQGQGNAAGGVPRLAGLPAAYLEKQLLDFSTAARPSEVMTTIAKSLTTTQRHEVAGYYARLPTPPAPASAPGQPTNAAGKYEPSRGQILVEQGDNALRVQACSNCHGPGAAGVAGTAMPYLAGQQGLYLRNALAAWREGKRNNDPSQQMPTIARRLRAADIDALIDYLEQPGQ